MSAKRTILTIALAAVIIIALVGAAAAIGIALAGKGTSYAFWSENRHLTSTETSDTTALADEYNPSEKYIVYDYYLIDEANGDWTRVNPEAADGVRQTEPDEDNIQRPKIAATEGLTTDATTNTTNLKAVMIKYTGNVSTLRVPDTTPVWIGGEFYDVDVIEIAALNMETSPGVAVVEKLIIGKNVKAMGYSRGVNGVVIKSGMFGFYALKEVTVIRDGQGTEDSNGYLTDIGNDKITAVGHFFEDSPYVTGMNVLIYSNFSGKKDAVPQKRAVSSIGEIFVGQETDAAPNDYMDMGIAENHAVDEGFKTSVSNINANGERGLTVYGDVLRTTVAGYAKFSENNYTFTIGTINDDGTIDENGKETYLLKRNKNLNDEYGGGLVYKDGNAVGRYEYSSFTIVVSLYEIKDGAVVVDEVGVEKVANKYYY